MNKIIFEEGTLVTPAKVNEDGTITPAVWEGNTPLTPHILNLMQDNIETAINYHVTDIYSDTKTYKIGDYCIHNNILYKCKTAVSIAEEFDESKWEETNIAKELENRLEFELVEEF